MGKDIACQYGEQRYFSIQTTYRPESDQLNWFVQGSEPNARIHFYSEGGAASAGAVIHRAEGAVPSFASLGEIPFARISIDPSKNQCQFALLQHGSAVSATPTVGLPDPKPRTITMPGAPPAPAVYEVFLLGPAAGIPSASSNERVVRFSDTEPQWMRIRQIS
jgi:hypothetical protein